MAIHWPENEKFCGIFSLNIGVYVYAFTNTLYNSWLMYFIWGLFLHLTRFDLNSIHIEDNEDSTEIVENWQTIVYMILLSLVIFLTVYKAVETFGLGLLLCGMWMKKPTILKLYTYFSVINWIVGTVLSFILSFFMDIAGRLILISLILIHAYMIMNARSLYLKMSGKSKLIPFDTPSLTVVEAISTERSNIQDAPTSFPHCRTCNCNQNMATPAQTFEYQRLQSNLPTPVNTPVNENSNVERELANGACSSNVRPTTLFTIRRPIIYDQPRFNSTTIDNDQNVCVGNRNENNGIVASNDQNSDGNKEKRCEKDVAVIYDETQLNVGYSPIYENTAMENTINSQSRNNHAQQQSTSNNDSREPM